ncbi:MAG TPA: ABC transporter permease [Spirochaetia bacterium]|nr:ABC transporter permease [Spirochaetia bacterium]HRZ63802.1 ABC transporter permease [Spirochaetia bacterium]
MARYIVKRIAQMIPLLIGISIVIFGIIQAAPGGPEGTLLDRGMFVDPAAIDAYRAKLGVDKPLYLQYLRWAGAMLGGDMGVSFQTQRPVLDMIAERLPDTVRLMGISFALAFCLAIPLGVFSALRQYSVFDYVSTGLAFVAIAMPVFWFGLMLQYLFSVRLQWLPVAGTATIGVDTLLDKLKHIAMPATVLSLTYVAGWSRYMRSSMLVVLKQDYIRTAHSKGLLKKTVIVAHALKNAGIPVVSVITQDIARIFSGAVITETIFGWPGIGRMFIQAMSARDYPLLMGILMMGSTMVVAFNLLADIIYGWLDPRISFK